ncbi:MAG: deoxyribose-phosphate aldolase [Fervidicoccaceae archaeon]
MSFPFTLPKSGAELARFIDHTMIRPTDTLDKVIESLDEIESAGFRALVVSPWLLPEIASLTTSRLASVIGFPHGSETLHAKLYQVREVAELGAREADVVINLCAVKSGRKDLVVREISELTREAHERGLIIKFIIETGLLSEREYLWAAEKIVEHGADFVKTNTGHGPRGVLPEDVVKLRRVVGNKAGIKASGGIRSALQALVLLWVGADVIGTSNGLEIVREYDALIKEGPLRELPWK